MTTFLNPHPFPLTTPFHPSPPAPNSPPSKPPLPSSSATLSPVGGQKVHFNFVWCMCALVFVCAACGVWVSAGHSVIKCTVTGAAPM